MNNILVIGNPTLDFVKGECFGPGGPVTYVVNSLSKLSEKKIHILTSFGEDFSIENFTEKSNLFRIESEFTNKFNFFFKSEIREIHANSYGGKLKVTDLKLDFTPEMIYISPVLNEFSILETKLLMKKFKKSFFIGMPQGWIRKLIADVVRIDFSDIKKFPFFDILFFSEEEILNTNINIEEFRKLAKILVITRGHKGSSVYNGKNTFEFPSKKVKSLNTIGAGDIFATVFSHTFFHSKNISFAGHLANEIAAKSTMYKGLKSINSDVFKIAMKRK
tara:strand:- start:14754 stop:15581 length:828 start_codon:yes stop_codon:yes gene_type:complete